MLGVGKQISLRLAWTERAGRVGKAGKSNQACPGRDSFSWPYSNFFPLYSLWVWVSDELKAAGGYKVQK